MLSPPAGEPIAGLDYATALPYYDDEGVETLAEDGDALMADVDEALAPPEVSWL